MDTQTLVATQRRSRARRLLSRMAIALAQWAQHARTRQQLAQLSGQELSDAGLSHGDRMAELSKPFWRE